MLTQNVSPCFEPTSTNDIFFCRKYSKMCCPHRRIVDDAGFRVCASCGQQDDCPIFVRPHACQLPAARPPYCRKKRFQKLLHNVWSARLPNMKDQFVKYIQDHNPQTPDEIIELIRTAKPRDYKRYDCISRLSIEFLNHRPEPLTQCQISECMGIFERVEIVHRRQRGVFPAYSFLIELCLVKVKRPDLIQYIHRLKCPRRRTKYLKLYGPCFRHKSAPRQPSAGCRLDLCGFAETRFQGIPKGALQSFQGCAIFGREF